MNDLGDIKLADFGFSKQFKIPFREDTENVGSIPYMAPELLAKRKDYSVSVDLWAVGCIMYYMMTGNLLCNIFDLNKDHFNQIIDQQIQIFGTKAFRDSKVFEGTYYNINSLKEVQGKGFKVGNC
jgi:serine/threonine protein kinase